MAHYSSREPRYALEEWRTIFESAFEPVVVEPFRIGVRPLLVWELVYFKGRRRAGPR